MFKIESVTYIRLPQIQQNNTKEYGLSDHIKTLTIFMIWND